MKRNRFFSKIIREFLISGYKIICMTERSICLGHGRKRALFERESGDLLCEWGIL